MTGIGPLQKTLDTASNPIPGLAYIVVVVDPRARWPPALDFIVPVPSGGALGRVRRIVTRCGGWWIAVITDAASSTWVNGTTTKPNPKPQIECCAGCQFLLS